MNIDKEMFDKTCDHFNLNGEERAFLMLAVLSTPPRISAEELIPLQELPRDVSEMVIKYLGDEGVLDEDGFVGEEGHTNFSS